MHGVGLGFDGFLRLGLLRFPLLASLLDDALRPTGDCEESHETAREKSQDEDETDGSAHGDFAFVTFVRMLFSCVGHRNLLLLIRVDRVPNGKAPGPDKGPGDP